MIAPSTATRGVGARVGLVVATVLVIAISPWIGPTLHVAGGDFILWQIRVPRALLAALVGAVLGGVGAAFQVVFENPLATPDTTGTTAGAALGALAVLVLVPEGDAIGSPLVALGAFVGGLVVTLAVSAIAASRRARMEDVLLAGIALSLGASALATGLQVRADMATTFRAVRWSVGSVTTVGWQGVATLLPFALASLAVIATQVRALSALIAGEDLAATQGVDVVRARTLVLGAGALGVGACVAWCGPIAFVGLVVPHLTRRLVGATRPVLLPMSTVLGAGFLTLCDTIARVIVPGHELPVGVLTAGIGAPVLVWLVARRR